MKVVENLFKLISTALISYTSQIYQLSHKFLISSLIKMLNSAIYTNFI